MVTLQSVQSHTGLTHHFYFLTFGHSGAQEPFGTTGLVLFFVCFTGFMLYSIFTL